MSASIWRPLAVVIIASTLTPGCASKVYNHPALTTSRTPTAELTVIREKALLGAAVPYTVDLDGEKLVRLWTGSYAVMQLAPNSYTLTIYDGSTGVTTEALVELNAGDQTYILLEVELVGWSASGGVSVSNAGTTTSPTSVGPVGKFGLHAIPEQQARELMSNYDLVGSD